MYFSPSCSRLRTCCCNWVTVVSHNTHQHLFHSITVMSQWAWWRLKVPASRLLTQLFIQARLKENINAPWHWPLWGEITGDRWIPAQMASNAENVSIWRRHHGSKLGINIFFKPLPSIRCSIDLGVTPGDAYHYRIDKMDKLRSREIMIWGMTIR